MICLHCLPQTYFVSKQYQRAIALLRRHESIDQSAPFKYLLAKCHAETQEWDSCLAALGDGDHDEPGASFGSSAPRPPQPRDSVSMAAAVLTLRGRALEALDNRTAAVKSYTAALRADPYCYEAFSALADNHMLTNAEELALVDSLHVPDHDNWLKALYRCKCKKARQSVRQSDSAHLCSCGQGSLRLDGQGGTKGAVAAGCTLCR